MQLKAPGSRLKGKALAFSLEPSALSYAGMESKE
jgi:hypothetical protein